MTGRAPGKGSEIGTDNVYLDNAATTYPKPEQVYREVDRLMREVGGSAGRSAHSRAIEAGRTVFRAREDLAALLGAPDPLRVVFTKNATEALNLALLGVLSDGDHVVTSSMEHNSVMRPLEALKKAGVDYTVVACGRDGSLDPAEVVRAIRSSTRLVAVTHASNVTGTIMPVDEIAEAAHGAGALLLVDAAQSAGRLPIDVAAGGIDLLAFAGHKELFGPQGTGGLWVAEGLELSPLMFGGTGSRSSSLEQPPMMPDACESGTLNAPGIAGLGAGVRFVMETGVDTIRGHDLSLTARAMDRLSEMKDVTVYGPRNPEKRLGILPLTFASRSPTDVAALLDRRYDISCRAGLHCSPSAHRTTGTLETGSLRVSFSYLSTADQVDYFLDSLGDILGGPGPFDVRKM